MKQAKQTILQINSSGRFEGSITRQTSELLVKKLQQGSTNSQLVKRELATGLPFIDEQWIADIKATMPALPNELHKKFTTEFGLSEYDAGVLTESKPVALYFNELSELTKNYKAASNWVTGDIKSYLNEYAVHMEDFPLKPQSVADHRTSKSCRQRQEPWLHH